MLVQDKFKFCYLELTGISLFLNIFDPWLVDSKHVELTDIEANCDLCGVKEISPEYSLEGLMLKLKLQYFGQLMQRMDSLEKTLILGKTESRRREWQRIRWLDGITNSMDMSLKALRVGDGQGDLAACSPWDHKESDVTEQ